MDMPLTVDYDADPSTAVYAVVTTPDGEVEEEIWTVEAMRSAVNAVPPWQPPGKNGAWSISADGEIPPPYPPEFIPSYRKPWDPYYQQKPLLSFKYKDGELHKEKLYTLGICYMCQDYFNNPHQSYEKGKYELHKFKPDDRFDRRGRVGASRGLSRKPQRQLQNAVVDTEEGEPLDYKGGYQEFPQYVNTNVAGLRPEDYDSADDFDQQENYTA